MSQKTDRSPYDATVHAGDRPVTTRVFCTIALGLVLPCVSTTSRAQTYSYRVDNHSDYSVLVGRFDPATNRWIQFRINPRTWQTVNLPAGATTGSMEVIDAKRGALTYPTRAGGSYQVNWDGYNSRW